VTWQGGVRGGVVGARHTAVAKKTVIYATRGTAQPPAELAELPQQLAAARASSRLGIRSLGVGLGDGVGAWYLNDASEELEFYHSCSSTLDAKHG
jgi:hypothetical protein